MLSQPSAVLRYGALFVRCSDRNWTRACFYYRVGTNKRDSKNGALLEYKFIRVITNTVLAPHRRAVAEWWSIFDGFLQHSEESEHEFCVKRLRCGRVVADFGGGFAAF